MLRAAMLLLALLAGTLMMTGCTTQEDTAPELWSSTMENRPALLQEGS